MTELTKVKNTNKSSLAKRSIQKMLSNKLAMIGLIVVILFALMSIFAPFITKHDPNSIDMSILNQPPGNGHLFGTDSTGRDLFSRLLYGGRMSIMIGTVSALTTSIIGTILGLITGYFRGWVDKIFVRLAPMVAPAYTSIDCYIHYFFVPNRIVFEDWQEFIAEDMEDNIVPVSYTHLDVYKRQI